MEGKEMVLGLIDAMREKIEEQAREIERLEGALYKERLDADEQRQELDAERLNLASANAALNAQPSGVVLPERKQESPSWGYDMGGNYDEGHADGFNACLDEVARLNQPASGGIVVPEEFICDSKPLQDLLNATALMLETPCQDSATYWAAMLENVEALLKPASGGDDRANLDSSIVEEVITHMDLVWSGEADEDVTVELTRRLREFARAALPAREAVADIEPLLIISRKILAKLQHPTASVHAGDMWKLEAALAPFAAPSPGREGE